MAYTPPKDPIKADGMTTEELLERILKEMQIQTMMLREAFDTDINEEDLD